MSVQDTDEDVVKKVQQGDVESFGILVSRFEARLLRYGRRFLSSRDDIVDLVQDIFIRVYTNINSFNLSFKFSSWIYRIAHNVFVNALRQQKNFPVLYFDFFDELLPLGGETESPEDESVRNEIRQELVTLLDSLPLKYREILILFYFEDMDYDSIADILHIPISTVGVRLRRGKTYLKKILTKNNI